MARGAKPATLTSLAARNEERHRKALESGSYWAKRTEARRQQAAARAADAAAVGSAAGDAGLDTTPPTVEDAKPPRRQRRAAAAKPAAEAQGEPATPASSARPSLAHELIEHGITGTLRRRLGSR